MKCVCILFLIVATCSAAPVDNEESSSATKFKRGIYFGADYHAPLLSHATYVSAPAAAVVHHAPLIAHAPALAVAHAPLYSSHSIFPALHSYHHY